MLFRLDIWIFTTEYEATNTPIATCAPTNRPHVHLLVHPLRIPLLFAYEDRRRCYRNWGMKGPNTCSSSVNDRLREHGDDRKNPSAAYVISIFLPWARICAFGFVSLLCWRYPIDGYPVKAKSETFRPRACLNQNEACGMEISKQNNQYDLGVWRPDKIIQERDDPSKVKCSWCIPLV